MIPHYERHELSGAFFDMTPDEYIQFERSIGMYGVREPVLIFEEKVLDGWQRYSTAVRLGLKTCPFKQFVGTFEEAVEEVRRRHNRRNLTVAQQTAAALRLEELRLGRDPAAVPKTNEKIAEETGVSVRTVEQGRAVMRTGTKELHEAIDSGAVPSLKKADQIARLPAEEQRRVIATRDFPTPKAAPWRAAPGAGSSAIAPPAVGISKAEADELRESLSTLAEDHDAMQARLAVHFMDATDEEKAAHEMLLKSLQEQVRVLTAELNAVKGSRNHYMEENNELKRQCAQNDRELARYRDLARTAVTRRA